MSLNFDFHSMSIAALLKYYYYSVKDFLSHWLCILQFECDIFFEQKNEMIEGGVFTY